MANEIKKINKIFLVPLLPNDFIPSTFFSYSLLLSQATSNEEG